MSKQTSVRTGFLGLVLPNDFIADKIKTKSMTSLCSSGVGFGTVSGQVSQVNFIINSPAQGHLFSSSFFSTFPLHASVVNSVGGRIFHSVCTPGLDRSKRRSRPFCSNLFGGGGGFFLACEGCWETV